MAKQILSIGKQSFRRLREDNCIYVDKTELLYNLCTQGSVYFLSRPRRFGKSLIVSTLAELFKGSRDLFTGLWIEDKWDWTKTNPVIHISFSSVAYKNQSLEVGIRQLLLKLFKKNELEVSDETDIGLLFADLIEQLHDKQGRVVILIDEYDKPIIDYLEFHKLDQAKENQDILANFYAGLKDCDEYIRLLFITGVSKFTKVSLFSKLNNLTDLTVNPMFSTLTGYTKEEVEHYFEEYIQHTLAAFTPYNRAELLEKMRLWYNGYSWDGKIRMYNPYDIMLFFFNQDFQSFWFETGTPTFLLDKMLQQNFYQVEDIEVNLTFLNEYGLNNLEITSLMFQGGYLTIKEKKEDGELVLSYPNQEVKNAMYSLLISNMGKPRNGGGMTVQHLNKAFLNNDLERVKTILTALFDNLTYDVYMHQTVLQIEGFYHGLIYILFKYLGILVQSEVHTSKGRADAIVQTPTHLYFLEFKINSDGATALQQIKTKKYAAPFAADTRIKIGIGINFNAPTRELDGWEVAVLSS
jgi:Predicted AAA-ATPase/PD-(D/E)XK nuclease superfamily